MSVNSMNTEGADEEIQRQAKEHLLRWRWVGPEIEAVQHRALRAYHHEQHWQAIDSLLQMAYLHRVPRRTSGLIEYQRLIQKGRR